MVPRSAAGRAFATGFVFAAAALIAAAPAARAADACDPKDDLVAFPYTEQLAPCLTFLREAVGNKEAIDRVFVRRLVARAVSPRKSDVERKASLALVPGVLVADLAVLLDDAPLMDEILGFAVSTKGPGEDQRDRALSRLYVLRGPQILTLLAKRPEAEQKLLVPQIARGLVALLWPHIGPKNAARLIVGPNWELLDDENPQRAWAERVEDAVLSELE